MRVAVNYLQANKHSFPRWSNSFATVWEDCLSIAKIRRGSRGLTCLELYAVQRWDTFVVIWSAQSSDTDTDSDTNDVLENLTAVASRALLQNDFLTIEIEFLVVGRIASATDTGTNPYSW